MLDRRKCNVIAGVDDDVAVIAQAVSVGVELLWIRLARAVIRGVVDAVQVLVHDRREAGARFAGELRDLIVGKSALWIWPRRLRAAEEEVAEEVEGVGDAASYVAVTVGVAGGHVGGDSPPRKRK